MLTKRPPKFMQLLDKRWIELLFRYVTSDYSGKKFQFSRKRSINSPKFQPYTPEKFSIFIFTWAISTNMSLKSLNNLKRNILTNVLPRIKFSIKTVLLANRRQTSYARRSAFTPRLRVWHTSVIRFLILWEKALAVFFP